MQHDLLQIIDANLNRSREGLRVCEDIARFVIKDKSIAVSLKSIRHSALNALISSGKLSLETLLQNRRTDKDKVKFIDFKIKPKSAISDIFMSNIQRTKESLRVLEECSKIIDEKISREYRKLRFNTYDMEKRAIKKIRALSGS